MAKGGLAVQEGERRTKAVERILLDYFDAYGERDLGRLRLPCWLRRSSRLAVLKGRDLLVECP
jgi:hypothetical protein